jgi:tetratricopeptide (TPR) repeat protein
MRRLALVPRFWFIVSGLVVLGLVAPLGIRFALRLATAATAAPEAPAPPLFGDLGDYHRPVTTADDRARAYFDQGLALYYGFNHEEAIRAFRHAAKLDPGFAMAWWGAALAAGPNINNPAMDEEASKSAFEALQEAMAHRDAVSPVERDLIEALSKRYAWPAPEDRRDLDRAYAGAMKTAWAAHPGDPDAGALYAESMMDLRPWDLWTPDGEAQPGTGEIVSVLEAVLAAHPNHVGANHFYIHTMEASPTPEKALPCADRLGSLEPGAGHLVHMPSHIYTRLGRYAETVAANQAAVAADRKYLERAGWNPPFYTLYRAHNFHFLAYAAMFEGQRGVAMQAAREMVAEIPLEMVRAFPDFLDGFLGVPIHVMVRFGLWEDLVKEPEPPEDLVATRAFWRYGRTVALSSLGRTEEAGREFEAFEKAYAAVPESRLIGNNTARTVLAVAEPMAEGELEYRRGNVGHAFELLREAVRRDVELRYDEPWGWMQPVRHALGALLLEQGRVEEAEAAYRADLKLHPGNGWALKGLEECQRRTGRTAEADSTHARFIKAWAHSDIAIMASCYCRMKM